MITTAREMTMTNFEKWKEELKVKDFSDFFVTYYLCEYCPLTDGCERNCLCDEEFAWWAEQEATND